jgi:hypothetical protein
MKSIITNEIVDIIKNDISQHPDVDIKPFEFMSVHPIMIGLIKVYKHPNGAYLYLMNDINKKYYAEWSQDIGQIVYLDFKKNDYSKYYEFTSQGGDVKYNALLRLISDDELSKFDEDGFHHLTIGDNNYMIVKLVPFGEGYNIRERGLHVEDDQISDHNDDSDDEVYDASYEEDMTSVSLFDE